MLAWAPGWRQKKWALSGGSALFYSAKGQREMNTTHGQRFDRMCLEIRATMARVPWRTAMAPRTVLILNGVEKGLDTPDIVTACRAMYEDYAAVRACNKVLFRVFMRMLGKLG